MIKKFAPLFLLFLLSLFTLYLIFLSLISISIGLTNTDRAGFWMSILGGLLILCLGILLIRLILHIVRRSKVKDRYPED